MIDPVTVAIGSVTVGAINGGISLVQVSKQNQIIKAQKRQRIELGCLEAGFAVALLAPIIENRIMNKKLKVLRKDLNDSYSDTMNRISLLEQRVNSLNIDVIDTKLDMVIAATVTKPTTEEKPIKISTTSESE